MRARHGKYYITAKFTSPQRLRLLFWVSYPFVYRIFKDFHISLTNGYLSSAYIPAILRYVLRHGGFDESFRWMPGTGSRVKWTGKLKWKPLSNRACHGFVRVGNSKTQCWLDESLRTDATGRHLEITTWKLPMGHSRDRPKWCGCIVYFRTCIALIRKDRLRRKTSEF
jgi:hypothetical protein